MNPGDRVTPSIRLVRLLGGGAMGTVWIADHEALGTQVAVKLMSPALAAQGSFVERFQREARAAARIKSPHVVQVFDHGVTAEGVPYIVMELLEGEDLDHRVRRDGPLDPELVARVIRHAAKGLDRAHQIGIVHRDIKPANLFVMDVGGEAFVKILDFGIAKQELTESKGVTSTGTLLGTPLYMSPEQLLSAKHVDARADLWALGVVAYFALTARVPFDGETLGALSVAVHQGVFAPPSALRPELPAAVDAWMARALQKDPAARFGSALELAEALEEALGVAGRRTSSAPPPPPPPADAKAREPAAGEGRAEAAAMARTAAPTAEGAVSASGARAGAARGAEAARTGARVSEEVAASGAGGRKRGWLLLLLGLAVAAAGGGAAVWLATQGVPGAGQSGAPAIPESAAPAVDSAIEVAPAALGADAGAGADAGTDAGAGADAGTDAGAGADAGTDAGAGADAGADAGKDAGADAGRADAGSRGRRLPAGGQPPPNAEEPPQDSTAKTPPPPVNPDLSQQVCTEILPDGTRRPVPCPR